MSKDEPRIAAPADSPYWRNICIKCKAFAGDGCTSVTNGCYINGFHIQRSTEFPKRLDKNGEVLMWYYDDDDLIAAPPNSSNWKKHCIKCLAPAGKECTSISGHKLDGFHREREWFTTCFRLRTPEEMSKDTIKRMKRNKRLAAAGKLYPKR